MLGGGGVGLVLHLEHDGDEFNSVRRLAEYKVALTARARVVVLFKVGVREGHHSHRVELCQTVLLEALADHLCRLPRLEVLQPLYFLVANPQLVALPLYEGVFVQLALLCLKLKLGAQPIQLRMVRVPVLGIRPSADCLPAAAVERQHGALAVEHLVMHPRSVRSG